MPRQPNHNAMLNPAPFSNRSMPGSYPTQLAPYGPDMLRRDFNRPTESPAHDRDFGYGPGANVPSLFNPEVDPRRQYMHREEPNQKRQRQRPPFPEVETRYMLSSNRNPYVSSAEYSAPQSAPGSFGGAYSNPYNLQPRSQEPPSAAYPDPGRRHLSWAEAPQLQYALQDGPRNLASADRSAVGPDLDIGAGRVPDPAKPRFSSSSGSDAAAPSSTEISLPGLTNGLPKSRSPDTNETRLWTESLEAITTYPSSYPSPFSTSYATTYTGRTSSLGGALASSLLPPPTSLYTRSPVENGI